MGAMFALMAYRHRNTCAVLGLYLNRRNRTYTGSTEKPMILGLPLAAAASP